MNPLIDDAALYVKELFRKYCDETFLFHNLSHTQKVVSRVIEIGRHENITEEDLFILIIAAWFHDTGYLFTAPSLHEAESVKKMEGYLSGKGLPPAVLHEIAECILATKVPTHPQNLLQSILCDADTYHFGTSEFVESNEKVYLEFRLRNNGPARRTFIYGSAAMLGDHRFYTPYCIALLNEGKEKNLAWLTKSL